MAKPIIVLPDGNVFIPYRFNGGGMLHKRGDFSQQIFTFIMDDTHEQLHFDINGLHRLIAAAPSAFKRREVLFRPKDIQYLVERHGIEADHLKRLTRARLAEPGILVLLPDGTEILADGNHRAVARWRRGQPTMVFWTPTLDQCRSILLDLPDEAGLREVNRRPAVRER